MSHNVGFLDIFIFLKIFLSSLRDSVAFLDPVLKLLGQGWNKSGRGLIRLHYWCRTFSTLSPVMCDLGSSYTGKTNLGEQHSQHCPTVGGGYGDSLECALYKHIRQNTSS